MVVCDQRPVIDADGHIGRSQIVSGMLRQIFKAPPEIVTEQAERAALKRQIVAAGGMNGQRVALLLHQPQRIVRRSMQRTVRLKRRDVALGHQRGARIGGEHIEAIIGMIGVARGKQHRPGKVGKPGEIGAERILRIV